MKTATVIKMPRARPGTAGYKWTDAQRKKFRATAARKKAARLAEKRQERRSKGGESITAGIRRRALERRTAAERIEDEKDALVASLGGSRSPQTGRKRKPGPEERLDAIVYLSRAYAAYEGIPDEALLGLLALRTLQGRIK